MATAAVTNPLSRYPLLRLTVPWMAGIVAVHYGATLPIGITLCAVAFAILLLLWFLSRLPAQRLALRIYWFPTMCVLLFGVSIANTIFHQPILLPIERMNHGSVCGRVDDIFFDDYGMRIDVRLVKCFPNLPDVHYSSALIRLNTSGCNYRLKPGDMVVFPCRLSAASNNGNPDEFDYQAYLADRGIRYRQHIKASDLSITGYAPTVITRLKVLRNRIAHRIYASGLQSTTSESVVALVLGDSRPLPAAVRERMAQAGVAHLFALSGLHVGIVVLLLYFLLLPLTYIPPLRWLRPAIIFTATLAYAALTGFAPSVCRATLMVALVLLAEVTHRKVTPFNALLLAALIILWVDPSALRNVGFQFSFLTVGSLLLFGPRISGRRKGWRKVWSYLYVLLGTTLIATLSTSALSGYYFHRISLSGLVVNPFVIPLFPLLMCLCAVYTFVAATGVVPSLLRIVMEMGFSLFNTLTDAAANWKIMHWNNVYVTQTDVSLYYIGALFAALWLLSRQQRWLLVVGTTIIICQCTITLLRKADTPTAGIVVFNEVYNTPVLLFSNGQGLLCVPDTIETDLSQTLRHYSGVIAHYGIDHLQLVPTDGSTAKGECMMAHSCGQVRDTRIAIVGGQQRNAYRLAAWQPDVWVVAQLPHDTIPLRHNNKVVIAGKADASKLPLKTAVRPHYLDKQGAYIQTMR